MKKKLSILAAVVLVVLMSLFGQISGQETLPAAEPAQLQSEITAPAETESTLPETAEAAPEAESAAETDPAPETQPPIDRHGSYTTKEDVALYIHTYGCLPENFMTKDEARKLGWEGGGLDDFAYGMCIGGDRFGN